jgi:hypothetical protein
MRTNITIGLDFAHLPSRQVEALQPAVDAILVAGVDRFAVRETPSTACTDP